MFLAVDILSSLSSLVYIVALQNFTFVIFLLAYELLTALSVRFVLLEPLRLFSYFVITVYVDMQMFQIYRCRRILYYTHNLTLKNNVCFWYVPGNKNT